MALLIKCECGYVARGETNDQVVSVLQVHMTSDHPDLVGKVSTDDIKSWIQVDA